MHNTQVKVSLATTANTIGKVALPLSKSINNRALIIQALQGNDIRLVNRANARDTELMHQLLMQEGSRYNAMDAGTTMRFLTAYLSIQNRKSTIFGTDRMHQRPIGILVDALKEVGAKINYEGEEGYPPLLIQPFTGQVNNRLEISGSVSSQYISALMMIAPVLPNGLDILIRGKIGSRPYIEMTASLMNFFGAQVDFTGAKISVPATGYSGGTLAIEPDWSAASYWYSIVALSGKSLLLSEVGPQSFQGDRKIIDFMSPLGVKSTFNEDGLHLESTSNDSDVSFDFSDTPDLAQTIAVVCAAKGISAQFTGLESLRIKETDRIAALQKELGKIGAQLHESDGAWTLTPTKALPKEVSIETYEDHRMAMAFAPLGSLLPTTILDPQVVRKSYPDFWKDLKGTGFRVD